MSILEDFESKDIGEQIPILGEIESQKEQEAIPRLFDICGTLEDDLVRDMAESTLRVLLAENEAETLRGLGSDDPVARRICVEVSGQQRFQAAAPILVDLAAQKDNEPLFGILYALSEIGVPETIEAFRTHMDDADPWSSALSIEMIGRLKDVDSLDKLSRLVEQAETDEHYQECELTVAKAVEALGALGSDASVSFLVSKIHHRNPTCRMLIRARLVAVGPQALPFLAAVFDQDNVDAKIMATDVLGLMGSREAGTILVNVFDKGSADHANLRFTMYEALGLIASMKCLVCLVDGLSETEEMILTAVVSSLDRLANQWILEQLKDAINKDNSQGDRIIGTIISSGAMSFFEYLYEDEGIAARMIEAAVKRGDNESSSSFREKLEQMGGDRAKADAEKLSQPLAAETGKKILAVDDSKSILVFYRSIVSALGADIVTAENGGEAMELLEKGEVFDLVVTDMNMPVMDGIELTRKIRELPALGEVPIIMATTESEKSQTELAQKAGVNDFLTKPFSPEVLQNKIKEFF